MASKKGNSSSYSSVEFQQLLQDLADAAHEIDLYAFANQVPDEHAKQAKEYISNLAKKCTSALSREASRVVIPSFSNK